MKLWLKCLKIPVNIGTGSTIFVVQPILVLVVLLFDTTYGSGLKIKSDSFLISHNSS